MAIAVLVACSGATFADEPPVAVDVPYTVPLGEGEIEEFLRCELPDGNRPYVNVSPSDMPWRVAIDKPRNPPKYGSRKEARAVAIAAMREWERSIQTQFPWFVLEFVEKDRRPR